MMRWKVVKLIDGRWIFGKKMKLKSEARRRLGQERNEIPRKGKGATSSLLVRHRYARLDRDRCLPLTPSQLFRRVDPATTLLFLDER